MKTVVLDTNVLLADPGALLGFPDTNVVIPETVLGELDKLKTSRVDPDLRFRGREVSRILFDLSDQGSLIDGVDLPEGGQLSVIPLDAEAALPEGLTTRNADDRILAAAYQVVKSEPEGTVTLITNDLNMLLKAQTYGVPVQRHGDGIEGSFARRYIVRPFQRYKIPLGILAMALAVFLAIVVIAIYYGPGRSSGTPAAVSQEFKNLLSAEQRAALDYLTALQTNPNDRDALRGMGNLYFDLREQTQNLRYAQQAISYYEKYLKLVPNDQSVRADLAVAYFYAGQTDRAIQEIGKVLEDNPNHVEGNYNLGVFYWRGRGDLPAAAAQYQKVIELTENSTNAAAHGIYQQAQASLQAVIEQAAASGVALPGIETTTSGGLL